VVKQGGENEEELKAKVAREIGKVIGILHKNQIIHGDLTTSNFLILKDSEPAVVYFIDFGLSFSSNMLEDKAVDLYVLERALLSTHSEDAERIFEQILKAYAEAYDKDYDKVHERLEQVRLRGRKRTMVG
jgi:TP53 regulating kinase-like protein